MKNDNETQSRTKRWALSFGLLSALGFTLSVHFSPTDKNSPNFAQLGASPEQLEQQKFIDRLEMIARQDKEGEAHLSTQAPPQQKGIPVVAAALKLQQEEEQKKKATQEAQASSTAQAQASNKPESSTTTQENRWSAMVPDCNGKGVLVNFFKDSNGQTVAVYKQSQLEMESASCKECLISRPLNVPFHDGSMGEGLAQLQDALMKSIKGCPAKNEVAKSNTISGSSGNAETAVANTQAVETSKKVEEKTEEEKHKEVFSKMNTACEKKYTGRSDRLGCRMDGVTKLLSDSKVNYTKSVVMDFFKKNIESPLKQEFDSFHYDYTRQDIVSSSTSYREYKEKLDELLPKIRELQSEIRDEYSYLRGKTATMSAEILAKTALKVNQQTQDAKEYTLLKDHGSALAALRSATDNRRLFGELSRDLYGNNYEGLEEAIREKTIERGFGRNIYSMIKDYGLNLSNRMNRLSEMKSLDADELLNSRLKLLDDYDFHSSYPRSLLLSEIDTKAISARKARLVKGGADALVRASRSGTLLRGNTTGISRKRLESSRGRSRVRSADSKRSRSRVNRVETPEAVGRQSDEFYP